MREIKIYVEGIADAKFIQDLILEWYQIEMVFDKWVNGFENAIECNPDLFSMTTLLAIYVKNYHTKGADKEMLLVKVKAIFKRMKFLVRFKINK